MICRDLQANYHFPNQLESAFLPPRSNLLAEACASSQGYGPNVAQFVFVAGTHTDFEGVRLGTQVLRENGRP